jgi:hypothetical protein
MYVKISEGAVETYPYSFSKLRADNPNVSFPAKFTDEQLAEWGVYPVVEAEYPDFDWKTQECTQSDQPTLVNGSWTLTKTVATLSAEAKAAQDEGQGSEVRQKRDQLLRNTDYFALADSTLTDEMRTYRQALRDITSHANFPYLEDADWPVKP